MTIDVIPENATPVDDEMLVGVEEISEVARLTEEAYALAPDKFAALKVADRDLIMFLLLREMAGTIRALEFRLDQYEAKAKELASPEGIQEITNKFLGGMGGGGMFGGLFS